MESVDRLIVGGIYSLKDMLMMSGVQMKILRMIWLKGILHLKPKSYKIIYFLASIFILELAHHFLPIIGKLFVVFGVVGGVKYVYLIPKE